MLLYTLVVLEKFVIRFTKTSLWSSEAERKTPNVSERTLVGLVFKSVDTSPTPSLLVQLHSPQHG